MMILNSMIKSIMTLTCLLVSVWLVGCVDVPSNGPPVPNFNSEFRFINAAEDLGDVTVTVDGASMGTAAYKGATSYTTYDAGSRVVALSSGDTQPIGMATDQRASVVILPLTEATRTFLTLNERRIFDAEATAKASLRITNAGIDTVQIRTTKIDTAVAPPDTTRPVTSIDTVGLSFNVTVSGADTTVEVSNLSFAANTGYLSIPTGNYVVKFSAAGATIDSVSVSLSAKRQSAVIMGSAAKGSLTIVDFVDN